MRPLDKANTVLEQTVSLKPSITASKTTLSAVSLARTKYKINIYFSEVSTYFGGAHRLERMKEALGHALHLAAATYSTTRHLCLLPALVSVAVSELAADSLHDYYHYELPV